VVIFLVSSAWGAAGLALVKADRSKVSSLIETNYIRETLSSVLEKPLLVVCFDISGRYLGCHDDFERFIACLTAEVPRICGRTGTA
jgi:hypothetical protein